MSFLKSRKIGFIGAGNMAEAIVGALVTTKTVEPNHVFIHNRSEKKQDKLVAQYGVVGVKNNEEIIENSDIIFVCVKPQDLADALGPIAMQFVDTQIVVSVAAGISMKSIQRTLPSVKRIVRAMPNTPIKLQKGVIGYCLTEEAEAAEDLVRDLLSPMGHVVRVEEGDQFEAVTVAASAGIGFVFELMMYWQGWLEERGFTPEESKQITIRTFAGASELAVRQDQLTLEELQDAVVSKKGVTAAGLESMREEDIERVLRIGFEKAALRDKEIGDNYQA